jgi:hypothetical protein
MRGHFGHLHFKTFSMTPRTPQCKVFWALLLNSKHLGVLEDSKSPTLRVSFILTLGQSGVATCTHPCNANDCYLPYQKTITFLNSKVSWNRIILEAKQFPTKVLSLRGGTPPFTCLVPFLPSFTIFLGLGDGFLQN